MLNHLKLKFVSSTQRLLQQLTEPHPSLVQDAEKAQQAALVASFLLILLLAGTIVLPILSLVEPLFALPLPMLFGAITVFAVAYALSRTRHYRLGAYMMIVIFPLWVAMVIIAPRGTMAARMLSLNLLVMAILLASSVFTIRATVFIAGTYVAAVASLALLPDVPTMLVVAMMTFMIVMYLFIIATMIARNNYTRQFRESNIRYHTLFEQSHDAVFLLSLEGKHIVVNQRAADMLGYTLAEMQGLSYRDLSAEVPESQAIQERLHRGEHIPTYERIFRKKNGDLIPVEINVELVRDVNGSPLHIQSVVRDISQRKRMEQALQESEARYRSIVTTMVEGVILQDSNGIIQACNAAAERILGLAAEQMLGHPINPRRPAIHEDGTTFPLETYPAMITLCTGKSHQNVVMGINKPDGSLTWISINSQPLMREHETQLYAVLTTFHDITERKQAEMALQQSEARHRALLSAIPDLMFRNHQDSTFWDYHVRNIHDLWIPPEQFLGRTIEQVLPQEIAQPYRYYLDRALQTGAQQMFEYTLLINGEEKHYEARIVKCEPGETLTIVRNITDRKQAERALQEARMRQNALLEAIPDIMFRHDRDGNYLDYHAPNEADLIMPPSQFMGHNLGDVLPPDLAALTMQNIKQALHTGQQQLFEYTLMYDRESKYFEARVVACAPNETLTIVRNITERKQTEMALRQSEARFSTVFRNSPVPMVMSTTDPHQPVYVEANDAYLQLVGCTWEELAGQNMIDMGIAIADQRRDARMLQLEQDKTYSVQEAQIRNRFGGIRDVLISAQRVYIGKEEYDIELILDITERKLLEQQALALTMEMERVKVLTRFIQDVSHEFRTPLTIINTALYLISKTPDEDKRTQHTERIKTQIFRLTRLVDMLLVMSKLDSGTPFSFAATNLNALLRQVAARIQTELAEKSISLHLNLPAEMQSLQIDVEQFSLALGELFDNAMRYTPAGGSITINLYSRDKQQAVIEICDTGVGIAREALPNIFKRFWRQDEAHSTPGVGLGLPIAQKVIERHGGTIEVESTLGTGSIFRIKLPMPSDQIIEG